MLFVNKSSNYYENNKNSTISYFKKKTLRLSTTTILEVRKIYFSTNITKARENILESQV